MIKYFKHFLNILALCTFITLIVYGSICRSGDCTRPDSDYEEYERILIYIITGIQLLVILAIPQILCNFIGLTIFNPFPGDIKIKDTSGGDASKDTSPIETPTKDMIPHMCFRVVTRGLYPDLVNSNVQKNFLTCIEAGLTNFSFEVVTDKEIFLNTTDIRIRELVVPKSYRSKTGAMFKARALQYALDDGHSPVAEGNYIVHLDEETMITRNVVNGIINFIIDGNHAFGQGLITYNNLEIVNIYTTLADSYRVADDMGKLRFQLAALHRPIFGWKGSFVVTKYEAEKDVSFDHGPDGSIAEDCYFSMVAFKKGYTFDFIQGEMHERSPFTILDFIRQRKRWIQGIWLVVHSSDIPIRIKFFLAMSHYAWLTLPITSISYIVAMTLGLPTLPWLTPVGSFCFAVTLYMYIFGLIKSFDLKNRPIYMLFVYLVGQVITLPLNIINENIAVIWGLATPKHTFYIVQKDVGHKAVLDV